MMTQNQKRKFYSVTADNKSWSRDAIDESDFVARGYKVQESRLHGDFDLFYQGQLVAHLFVNKQDAARHVQHYGCDIADSLENLGADDVVVSDFYDQSPSFP